MTSRKVRYRLSVRRGISHICQIINVLPLWIREIKDLCGRLSEGEFGKNPRYPGSKRCNVIEKFFLFQEKNTVLGGLFT